MTISSIGSYYKQLIQNFFKISKPLQDLLKINVAIIWIENCKIVFEELEQNLSFPPILKFPKLKKKEKRKPLKFSQMFKLNSDFFNLIIVLLIIC